ncbi:RidA family protein [Bacillus solimangrovi]|uniref:Enamine deaminase RidA n=1 Tax=Bacillus solimangrovi TaxID=1305675 RepID=A0A1E5LAL5_9BACI|nr:RidA family protein [Bacillus solimangrovi]OEH91124.1 enamine deaminase RidA [Bacillus solimangrovi]
MEIKKSNPESVAPPIGKYHHLTIIPRDAELLVLSGQVGNDRNGEIPDNIETQYANALKNITSILKSEGVNTCNIFKINIWFTENIDREYFTEKWSEFHNESPPATTLAYVSALARPEIKVEIEAWAAR